MKTVSCVFSTQNNYLLHDANKLVYTPITLPCIYRGLGRLIIHSPFSLSCCLSPYQYWSNQVYPFMNSKLNSGKEYSQFYSDSFSNGHMIL